MIKNRIPRLIDPLYLAEFENSIPPMYRHQFIFHYTHIKEKIRHAGFTKVWVHSTHQQPGLVEESEALAMAKDHVKGLGLKGLYFGKAQHLKTQATNVD